MSMTYPTMVKAEARKAKYGMEPLPQDPRVEVMYPGMVTSEKVLDAVEKMREENWDLINDAKRNNTSATKEEIQTWADAHPWADMDNLDVQAEIQDDLQRIRTQKLMYSRSMKITSDEIQAAKNYGISQDSRLKLEKAAGAWRDEKGTWEGWETRRLEMIKELSGE